MATKTTDPSVISTEPVAVSEVVRYIAGILVATGWLTISDDTLNIIITVVGALLSLAMTIWTRKSVTPVAEPHNTAGNPLVPLVNAGGTPGETTPPLPTQPQHRKNDPPAAP